MIESLGEAFGGPVSRETAAKIERYVSLLLDENSRQNLISRGSVEDVWQRHIIDSAQLLRHAPTDASWLDIGSGPGLPGMVLAMRDVREVTMVEPRRLRTAFLERCRDELDLKNVTIVTGKTDQLSGRYDVITARAVASIDRLFAISLPLSHPESRWVLPKGRSAAKELEEARRTWQGNFRLEPSVTDPESRILVAEAVRRKAGRG
ncbi:16S rRNA (guanine(527)-N(7))-methyltransferase RsmG [Sphingomonas rosea]|uniref:Ribosomal RNA small subunit methyltransferase G n=1 Tax=Sphingomonas rosea TaxID=335605 RepID=A0ABP7TW80_9SPHN